MCPSLLQGGNVPPPHPPIPFPLSLPIENSPLGLITVLRINV